MATQPEYPLLSAEDFLDIDFGERKAELDNGVIHMMAGGTRRHARVAGNIMLGLAQRLRGTGCVPYNSDMAVQTRARSIRYPDVSIFCGREGAAFDEDQADDSPRIIFEVLSQGTARSDLRIKQDEYRALDSIDTIVFVDIATERLRVVQRTGPTGWSDNQFTEPSDLALPSLDLILPHSEIFARD